MAHPPPSVPASSDSVNSFPLCLMSHEFTLLTPLHSSLAFPASLSFFIIIKGTQAHGGETDFLRQHCISRAFFAKSAARRSLLQGLPIFLQFVSSVRSTDHIHISVTKRAEISFGLIQKRRLDCILTNSTIVADQKPRPTLWESLRQVLSHCLTSLCYKTKQIRAILLH